MKTSTNLPTKAEIADALERARAELAAETKRIPEVQLAAARAVIRGVKGAADAGTTGLHLTLVHLKSLVSGLELLAAQRDVSDLTVAIGDQDRILDDVERIMPDIMKRRQADAYLDFDEYEPMNASKTKNRHDIYAELEAADAKRSAATRSKGEFEARLGEILAKYPNIEESVAA
jgi:hypothetical protein